MKEPLNDREMIREIQRGKKNISITLQRNIMMIFTASAVIRLEAGRTPGILPRKRFCILFVMWNSTIIRT